MTALMKNAGLWRWVALTGFFGTLVFLLLWIIWLAPPESPRSVVLAIALLPMLAPLRGLLHGRRYTHSWASFLALPYFAFGIDALIHRASDNWLGGMLTLLSVLWFFGCVYYARYLGQSEPIASKPVKN